MNLAEVDDGFYVVRSDDDGDEGVFVKTNVAYYNKETSYPQVPQEKVDEMTIITKGFCCTLPAL